MTKEQEILTARLIDGCPIAECWAMGIITTSEAYRQAFPAEFAHQRDTVTEYVAECDRGDYLSVVAHEVEMGLAGDDE